MFADAAEKISNAWTVIMYLMQADVSTAEINKYADELWNIHKLIVDTANTHSPSDLSTKLTSFISYESFEKYDKEITQKYNFHSAIALTRNTLDEYLSQATVFGHQNDYMIRIIIPYVSKEPYTLWKLHPFPTKFNDKTHRKILMDSNLYALVSNDLQTITPVAKNSLKYCTTPMFDFYACLPIVNIGLTNHTNCPRTLMKQEKVLVCPLNDYVNQNSMLKWIRNTKYLSLSKPQEAVMICNGEGPKEAQLDYVNKINPGCSVKGRNLNIPSVAVFHEDLKYHLEIINITMPPFKEQRIELKAPGATN